MNESHLRQVIEACTRGLAADEVVTAAPPGG
jgi:hypothetical protein